MAHGREAQSPGDRCAWAIRASTRSALALLRQHCYLSGVDDDGRSRPTPGLIHPTLKEGQPAFGVSSGLMVLVSLLTEAPKETSEHLAAMAADPDA